MTDRHPESDLLVALALADLDAAEQQRLLDHLAACRACREDYAALADGVQQALAAAPAIAPPAGFSGRVLAAMAEPARATRRPRAWLLVAAAALVGLLTGVGATLTLSGIDRGPAAAQHSAATVLTTGSGDAVGSAGIATLGGRSYLVLTITAGKPGGSYECLLVGRDGRRTSGGSWRLGEYPGASTSTGSWLVPIDAEPPAAVELLGPSGGVWSRGTF
jgi:hypothetical protein